MNELGGKVDYILDCGDIESDAVSIIVQEDEKVMIIREVKITIEKVMSLEK